MERKPFSVLLVCVMLGLVSGQSMAVFNNFGNCMKDCLMTCVIPPWTYVCPSKCLAKCIIHPATVQTADHFCTLGCATSVCSKLITRDDPHIEEVESCVNLCSGSCNNSYGASTRQVDGN